MSVDMIALNKLSMTVRQDRARVRRDLRTGTLGIEELLDTRPASVANLALIDLLRLMPGLGGKRIVALNRHAIRDGVNLMVPLGSADLQMRGWLFSHVRRTPRTTFTEFSGYKRAA